MNVPSILVRFGGILLEGLVQRGDSYQVVCDNPQPIGDWTFRETLGLNSCRRFVSLIENTKTEASHSLPCQ